MSLPAERKFANSHTSRLGRRMLIALVASIVSTVGHAATSAAQPKLVVGIVVEDLRGEYINLLKDNFTPGGFNRLLRSGLVIANADFGTPVDATAATAIIYTGASPEINGIPSSEVFDRNILHGVSVFDDPQILGNYTDITVSPTALAVTTIADEAIVAGAGTNSAYAFAPDCDRALIMAGHAGDCGLWLNKINEDWATTTYYRNVPPTLNQRNRLEPLSARIDTMEWTPAAGIDAYVLVPENLTKYPFRYAFRKQDPKRMDQFLSSPKANAEVTNFAIENLSQLKLGQHPTPDMLSVAYTLKPYEYSINTDNRYELIDSYYQLDKSLEQLFDNIDKTVGLENSLIFLAGTPPPQEVPRDNERWMLPYGEFSTRKAISLLNLYLMALYGNGDWVQGYHNYHFFLNHKLIEQQKLDLEEIRLKSARFLERMAGVNKAYSLDEIIDGRTEANTPLRLNTNAALAGDVYVRVMPGWQIIDDFNSAKPRTDKVIRHAAPMAPAFIMTPAVEPQTIVTPVDARAIAPTVTSLMRIRAPNAAVIPPLTF